MQKVIAVGDIHAKTSNLSVIAKLFLELMQQVNLEKPNFVVLMGDLLNDHSKMHIQTTTVVFRMIKSLAETCKTVGAELFVLVGNHDMMNNTEVFPEMHALEGIRYSGARLVDTGDSITTDDGMFFFYPYLPPGRACAAVPVWY